MNNFTLITPIVRLPKTDGEPLTMWAAEGSSGLLFYAKMSITHALSGGKDRARILLLPKRADSVTSMDLVDTLLSFSPSDALACAKLEKMIVWEELQTESYKLIAKNSEIAIYEKSGVFTLLKRKGKEIEMQQGSDLEQLKREAIK